MKNQLTKYLADLDDEQFSGFMGTEHDLGFQGTQNDLGFNAAGAQCARPARVAMPYYINYYNSTGGVGAAFVVFGANRYADVTNVSNYGSALGVIITCGGGISYAELLAQSQTNPILINRWRFIVSNSADLQQTLTATYRDANGTQMIQPLPLSIYSDMYAYSTTILDVDFPAKVDGTFYLTGAFSIGNGTNIAVIAFPEAIVDTAQLMNNGQPIRTYNRPILSAAIANPQPKQIGIPKSAVIGAGGIGMASV